MRKDGADAERGVAGAGAPSRMQSIAFFLGGWPQIIELEHVEGDNTQQNGG